MTGLGGIRALVLDMDGVLIETRRSFSRGVLLSAAACAEPPGLRDGWSEREVERLRLCGGFNNDWDAAAALAALGPASAPGGSWEAVCVRLEGLGGGPGAAATLAGEARWKRLRRAVVPLFQRLYAGPRSLEAYGVAPTEPRGLYEEEEPLVSAEELSALGLPFGIFTGRTRGEASLGLERLGLDLPEERLVCDTQPRLRKPRPDGLLALAAALPAGPLLHVGDGADDLAAARNARAAGLDVSFAGIAPEGSLREARFFEGGALLVRPSLRQVLDEIRRQP
jgi:HAD superfamily hydrolase (TIGR01548 family)